jgi:signal transduction histidine kinase
MEENLQLQRRAEEAERKAQEERIRISQEIHDGAAQSAFMLSLGLETCRDMSQREAPQLFDRLKALHAESKQALWELRYPINLGPLFEGRGLAQILADHLANFRTITSIPTHLSVTGREAELPLVTRQRLFAVAHNALTNAYKYARATEVKVKLDCDDKTLKLSISDNGVGLDTSGLATSSGHGIRNMRSTAQELGGSLEIASAPGKGTTVSVALPIPGGAS